MKQEFYFIRHGQTDHNASEKHWLRDHPEDIALNALGRSQAENAEPLIASLPVQVICSSPLPRVQETVEIVTPRLKAPRYVIEDLKECSSKIWREMFAWGMYRSLPPEEAAREFIERIQRGMQQALTLPGIPLIIAHGGVHWALCTLLGIEEHPWTIDNCVPVHFSADENGKWQAQKLMYSYAST